MKTIILLFLLIVPLFFGYISTKSFTEKGAYWMNADPDYAYYVGGIYLASGHNCGFNAHPGMGLKYIIASVIRLSHPFMNETELSTIALKSSEYYMRMVNLLLLFFFVIVSWITGHLLYLYTYDVIIALVSQCGTLFFFVHYITYTKKIAAEMPLALYSLLLTLVFSLYLKDSIRKKHCWIYALFSGGICAFAVSTKMNYAPLIIIPFIIIPKIRIKLLYVIAFLLFLYVCLLPVPYNDLKRLFIRSLSSGEHASGSSSFSLEQTIASLRSFIRIDTPYFVILAFSGISSFIAVISAVFSKRIRKSPLWLVLSATWCGVVIQTVAVAKNEISYYMMPSFGFAGFLFAVSIIFLHQLVKGYAILKRCITYPIIAVLLYYAFTYYDVDKRIDSIIHSQPSEEYRELKALYERILSDPKYDAIIMRSGFSNSSHPTALVSGDNHQQEIINYSHIIASMYPRIFHYYFWLNDEDNYYKNENMWTLGSILHYHSNVVLIINENNLVKHRKELWKKIDRAGAYKSAYIYEPKVHFRQIEKKTALDAHTNMKVDTLIYTGQKRPLLYVGNRKKVGYAIFELVLPNDGKYNIYCNYTMKDDSTIHAEINGITYKDIKAPATGGNNIENVKTLMIPDIHFNAGSNSLMLFSEELMPQIEYVIIGI